VDANKITIKVIVLHINRPLNIRNQFTYDVTELGCKKKKNTSAMTRGINKSPAFMMATLQNPHRVF